MLHVIEDRGERYCICRGPSDGSYMIGCDLCEEWFHGACVNVDEATGALIGSIAAGAPPPTRGGAAALAAASMAGFECPLCAQKRLVPYAFAAPLPQPKQRKKGVDAAATQRADKAAADRAAAKEKKEQAAAAAAAAAAEDGSKPLSEMYEMYSAQQLNQAGTAEGGAGEGGGAVLATETVLQQQQLQQLQLLQQHAQQQQAQQQQQLSQQLALQ